MPLPWLHPGKHAPPRQTSPSAQSTSAPSEVASIGTDDVVLRGTDGDMTLANDTVIVQIGGTAPDEVLRQSGIAPVEKRGVA